MSLLFSHVACLGIGGNLNCCKKNMPPWFSKAPISFNENKTKVKKVKRRRILNDLVVFIKKRLKSTSSFILQKPEH